MMALLVGVGPVQAQTLAAYDAVCAQLKQMKAKDAVSFDYALKGLYGLKPMDAPDKRLFTQQCRDGHIGTIPREGSSDNTEVRALLFFDKFKEAYRAAPLAMKQKAEAEQKQRAAAAAAAAEKERADSVTRATRTREAAALAAAAKQRELDNAWAYHKQIIEGFKRNDYAYNKALKAIEDKVINPSDPKLNAIPPSERNSTLARITVFENEFVAAYNHASNEFHPTNGGAAPPPSDLSSEIGKAIDLNEAIRQQVLQGKPLGNVSDVIAHNVSGVIANHGSGVVANHVSGYQIASTNALTIQQALAMLDKAGRSNDRKSVLQALDALKSALQAAKGAIAKP